MIGEWGVCRLNAWSALNLSRTLVRRAGYRCRLSGAARVFQVYGMHRNMYTVDCGELPVRHDDGTCSVHKRAGISGGRGVSLSWTGRVRT